MILFFLIKGFSGDCPLEGREFLAGMVKGQANACPERCSPRAKKSPTVFPGLFFALGVGEKKAPLGFP